MLWTRSSATSNRHRRPLRRAPLQRRMLVVLRGTTRIAGRSRGGGSVVRLTVPGSRGWCCGRTSRRFWLVGTLTPTSGSSLPRGLRGGDGRWVRARTPRSEPMGSSSMTWPTPLRCSACRTGRSSGCSMSARRSLSVRLRHLRPMGAMSPRPFVLPFDLPLTNGRRQRLPLDLPRDLPFGLPLAL